MNKKVLASGILLAALLVSAVLAATLYTMNIHMTWKLQPSLGLGLALYYWNPATNEKEARVTNIDFSNFEKHESKQAWFSLENIGNQTCLVILTYTAPQGWQLIDSFPQHRSLDVNESVEFSLTISETDAVQGLDQTCDLVFSIEP